MTFVFDIDGTITANPPVFGKLMSALRYGGARVVVMTGALTVWGPGQIDGRKKQLADIGINEGFHYDELIVVVGKTVDEVATGKGLRCAELKAEMIFEDTPLYISEVRRLSPLTTTLMVTQ